METITKRTRAPNWETTEKALLKEVIKDELSIIECKLSDTNTNKAKNKSWQKVHNRFTKLNGRDRSLLELKQQWRCMKMDAKKALSMHRQAILRTGGGPKPPSPSKDTMDLVELLPFEFEVDHNEFDSNGPAVTVEVTAEGSCSEAQVSHMFEMEEAQREETVTTCIEVDENYTAIPSTSNAATPSQKYRPTRGRFGKSTKRKQLFEDEEYKMSIKKLAEERSARILQQQEEEHQVRMKNMQKEMDMKREEHEESMKFHEEEMKCLKEDAAMKAKIHAEKLAILKFIKDILLKKQCNF